jgi:hypothetical protein
MGLLIFAYRKQDIIRRKSDLEFKLTQMSEKLRNLQSYSSSISDGSVSLNDLMNAPASVFGRMSSFMMYSHQASCAGAQQKFPMMQMQQQVAMQQMPQMQNPQVQEQFSQMLFKNLYDQERQKFSKIEEKLLNEQDKKLSSEKEKLDTQLKMLDEELKSVSAAEDNSIKSSAPKFGLTG